MNRSIQRGFTLIEIVIAIGIVAIIAAIAFPSYQEQVRKSQRTNGKNYILQLAQELERCFTLFGAYDNANCPNGTKTSPDGGYYSVTITVPAGNTSAFTLSATPIDGAVKSDKRCAAYTYNQLGTKGATDIGGSDAKDYCW